MDDNSALRLSGYFLLGYLLRDRQARSWPQIVSLAFLFLAGGSATVFGTYMVSNGRGAFDPFFYNYFSITVFMMAIALFLMVKSVPAPGYTAEKKEPHPQSRIFRELGMSVFGIYLIHALVLELLRDGRLGFIIDHAGAFGVALPQAIAIPVFALAVFLLSAGAVVLFRSIPVIRMLLT
jgi:surface polysaccharide O-acyltransferase-like enzyme